MASSSHSISMFLLFTVIMSAGKFLAAGRAIPKMPTTTTTTEEADVTVQLEWFIDRDGSVLLPGIGRIMVPMPYSGSNQMPSGGGFDEAPPDNSDEVPPSGGFDNGQMPGGGDETTMPDPGSDGQVPVPYAGGAAPSPVY